MSGARPQRQNVAGEACLPCPRTDFEAVHGHQAPHLLRDLFPTVRHQHHRRARYGAAGRAQVDEEAGEALAELGEDGVEAFAG